MDYEHATFFNKFKNLVTNNSISFFELLEILLRLFIFINLPSSIIYIYIEFKQTLITIIEQLANKIDNNFYSIF